MSNAGVHDFAIPHEKVIVTRDQVIIQMPYPPAKVGSIHIPDMFRDVAQHNTMAGRIVAMGPVAFCYKNMDGGLSRHDANIGDWAVIRPFAGTQIMGGKISGQFGYRYVSTFNDVIGIIPAKDMPDPSTLLWDEQATAAATMMPKQDDFNFHNSRDPEE